MGIRDRIKRRLKGARDLIQRVQDEANYPGRPQPHMAARNPLWGGTADRTPEGVTPRSEVPSSTPQPAADIDPYAAKDDGEFWFLKESTVEDGWQVTNPGQPPEDEGDS